MSRKRGKEYSQDLQERVLEANGSIREVADRFDVSPSYVSKVSRRFRLTGQRGAARWRGDGKVMARGPTSGFAARLFSRNQIGNGPARLTQERGGR